MLGYEAEVSASSNSKWFWTSVRMVVKHAAPCTNQYETDLFLVSKGRSQPWFFADRVMWERMGKGDLLLKGEQRH